MPKKQDKKTANPSGEELEGKNSGKTGNDADVTSEDLAMLGDPDQDMDQGDDERTAKEGLDDTDYDGDPLNEAAVDLDTPGDDLDIPGTSSKKTRKQATDPEEDEENDYYSLGSSDNDELTEGTP